MKKNKTQKKSFIIKPNLIFTLCYIILLFVTYFTFSKNYVSLNFFQQFLGGPLIWIYSKFYPLNPSIAFIISFFVGTVIFFPKIRKHFISTLNFGHEFENIMNIHKDTTKTSEQRVNKMLDLMEEKDASLFAPFISFFYSFIWGFTTSGVFSIFRTLGTSKFLWFNLLDKDHLFILPSLITLFLIPRIIKNVKSIFKYENKMKTFLDVVMLIAKISAIVACYLSSLTCVIFIISFGYLILYKAIKRYREIHTKKV